MQTINTPDGGTMVMLALEEYEALVEAADVSQARAIKQRIADGKEELIPAEVAEKLVAG